MIRVRRTLCLSLLIAAACNTDNGLPGGDAGTGGGKGDAGSGAGPFPTGDGGSWAPPPGMSGMTRVEIVTRACVMLASCNTADVDPIQDSVSACIDAFGNPNLVAAGEPQSSPALFARLLACAGAPDCTSFDACQGGNWGSISL